MARLYGAPGAYILPSFGQLVTSSGVVACPDELAPELIAVGFRVEQWDGPAIVEPQAPTETSASDAPVVEPEEVEEVPILTTSLYSDAKPIKAKRKKG